MRQKIFDDIIKVMKEKDKETLSVLRMVKGAITLEEIDKKRELKDEEVLSVLTKQVKTRKDSIVEFEKANREDLKEKTEAEIMILNRYLPKQLTKEEMIEEVNKAFEKVNPTGKQDMGKIMKELSSLKGRADMAFLNECVKDKLAGI